MVPDIMKNHIDLMVEEGNVAKLQDLALKQDKATAKYARRGLHILRTKGFVAEVPRRREAPRILPIIVETPESNAREALLTAAILPQMMRRRRKPEAT